MRRDFAFWALTIPAIGLIIYGKSTWFGRRIVLVTPEADAKS